MDFMDFMSFSTFFVRSDTHGGHAHAVFSSALAKCPCAAAMATSMPVNRRLRGKQSVSHPVVVAPTACEGAVADEGWCELNPFLEVPV